jgi:hypothetical protein
MFIFNLQVCFEFAKWFDESSEPIILKSFSPTHFVQSVLVWERDSSLFCLNVSYGEKSFKTLTLGGNVI